MTYESLGIGYIDAKLVITAQVLESRVECTKDTPYTSMNTHQKLHKQFIPHNEDEFDIFSWKVPLFIFHQGQRN
jgi:hypothetical protein